MKTSADYSNEDDVLARSLPSHCEHGDSYGVVHIQRKLKVGYNRASYVIESAIEQGIVVSDPEKEWLFCLPKTLRENTMDEEDNSDLEIYSTEYLAEKAARNDLSFAIDYDADSGKSWRVFNINKRTFVGGSYKSLRALIIGTLETPVCDLK